VLSFGNEFLDGSVEVLGIAYGKEEDKKFIHMKQSQFPMVVQLKSNLLLKIMRLLQLWMKK